MSGIDLDPIKLGLQNASETIRAATVELNNRQAVITQLRTDKHEYQHVIGLLRDLLKNDDLDGARDLVQAEYDAIHGLSF